ncbi:beta-amylase [Salvia divinorum]|uniref:Beta-amylase n=1 Tax=Salvia divinorum TaxID=28513 RepID=A0ABD1GQA1_SALDI
MGHGKLGIDKQRVLRGRNALEVYFDYMRSFRVEFNEYLLWNRNRGWSMWGVAVPILSWIYPGIGEFQCYDKYLMESLEKAAEMRGRSIWGRAPDNAEWYSGGLVEHADEYWTWKMLSLKRRLLLSRYRASTCCTKMPVMLQNQEEQLPEALADPKALVWQVLNAAWDVGLPVASENALPCYVKQGYYKILDIAKPMSDPDGDGRQLSAFTYLRG